MLPCEPRRSPQEFPTMVDVPRLSVVVVALKPPSLDWVDKLLLSALIVKDLEASVDANTAFVVGYSMSSSFRQFLQTICLTFVMSAHSFHKHQTACMFRIYHRESDIDLTM